MVAVTKFIRQSSTIRTVVTFVLHGIFARNVLTFFSRDASNNTCICIVKDWDNKAWKPSVLDGVWDHVFKLHFMSAQHAWQNYNTDNTWSSTWRHLKAMICLKWAILVPFLCWGTMIIPARGLVSPSGREIPVQLSKVTIWNSVKNACNAKDDCGWCTSVSYVTYVYICVYVARWRYMLLLCCYSVFHDKQYAWNFVTSCLAEMLGIWWNSTECGTMDSYGFFHKENGCHVPWQPECVPGGFTAPSSERLRNGWEVEQHQWVILRNVILGDEHHCKHRKDEQTCTHHQQGVDENTTTADQSLHDMATGCYRPFAAWWEAWKYYLVSPVHVQTWNNSQFGEAPGNETGFNML